MKTCLSLFALLLVGSVLYPQEKPANQISPHTKSVSTHNVCIAATDLDVHVYNSGYEENMVYLRWGMQSICGERFNRYDGVNCSGIGLCPDMTAGAKREAIVCRCQSFHLLI